MTGVDEAVALLRTMGPGDAALVKGSRVARLEDVVRAYGEAEGVPSLTPAAAGEQHATHSDPPSARGRQGDFLTEHHGLARITVLRQPEPRVGGP